uniref:carbonic anhydrase n=1 Tax=Phytophthora ramorum TaxID=164328 RepID=H3GIU5_PHYRM
MKFITIASALVGACAITRNTVSAATTGGVPWGYKTNDATMAGPAQWADHYPTCGGSRQSPIDITTTTGNVATRSLAFSGSCGDYNLTQSDESFKASIVGGSCAASANGASYNLAQFHLHAPSEHTLDGKALDGEVHFVHSNADGSALLVVGVFLQVANGGNTDPWMVSVLDGMEAVTPTTPTTMSLGSYADLVSPNANRVYNYPGSLTTPGCDEIVDWWVVQQPISMSPADFTRLQTQLKELHVTDNGNNARPVLPLNGRTVVSLLIHYQTTKLVPADWWQPSRSTARFFTIASALMAIVIAETIVSAETTGGRWTTKCISTPTGPSFGRQVVDGGKADPFMVSVLDGTDNASFMKWESVSLQRYGPWLQEDCGLVGRAAADLDVSKGLQTQPKELHVMDNGKNAHPVLSLNKSSASSRRHL